MYRLKTSYLPVFSNSVTDFCNQSKFADTKKQNLKGFLQVLILESLKMVKASCKKIYANSHIKTERIITHKTKTSQGQHSNKTR